MTSSKHSTEIDGKSPEDSLVTMTEMVLPQHTNALGGAFGGVIMSWIDIAGAICAQRHSGQTCVTASIDELHFLRPVKLGMITNINARITAVHKTSCEIMVRVDAESPIQNTRFHTTSALLTFVALNKEGKPSAMPKLLLNSSHEKKLAEEARIRRKNRCQLKTELLKTKG